MSELRCFAGIDGGGSKTIAVVVDATGRELGRASAGSSNTTAVGFDPAVANLRQAIEAAAREAGSPTPLDAMWLGLAGIDRPGARDALLPHLTNLAREVRITNDAELLLTALDGAVGVALIAGTGSIALGRDPDGGTARAGGWGHLFGDEGSGWDLGQRALRAAARAADGRGPETTLLPAILERWGITDPLDIIGKVYVEHRDDTKPAVAELAGLVFAAARAGDAVARRILRDGADGLAETAIAAGRRLSFPGGALPIALSGGLLTGEPGYRAMVVRRLRRRTTVGQVEVVTDPALSAARALARIAAQGTGTGLDARLQPAVLRISGSGGA